VHVSLCLTRVCVCLCVNAYLSVSMQGWAAALLAGAGAPTERPSPHPAAAPWAPAPTAPAPGTVTVTSFKAAAVAQQLCLLDHAIMAAITPAELLSAVWGAGRAPAHAEDDDHATPNVAAFTARFNLVRPLPRIRTPISVRHSSKRPVAMCLCVCVCMCLCECAWVAVCVQESMWAATEVVTGADAAARASVLRRLIETARECFDANNFFSVFTIVSGLAMSPVQRLRRTWAVRALSPPHTHR
jgi:hypothetical protein